MFSSMFCDFYFNSVSRPNEAVCVYDKNSVKLRRQLPGALFNMILHDISDLLLRHISSYFSCAIHVPHTMIFKINSTKTRIPETVDNIYLF